MGRRPGKSRFMPNVYVFPGGGVDALDARVNTASSLDQNFTSFMAVAGKHSRAQTIAAAAVRETFEETGLLISRAGSVGNINEPSWHHFHSINQAPDLAPLRYIGRAITPATQKIRFHARFFACNFDQIGGADKQVLRENGELLDLQWVRFSLADSSMTTDLPLRGVTRYMLAQLHQLVLSGSSAWIGNTIYSTRNGKLNIRTTPV